MDAVPARSEHKGYWSIDVRIVAVVMSVFALFGPLGFYVTSNVYGDVTLQVYAVTWIMSSFGSSPIFDMSISLFTLFGILRMRFVQQMYRYYRLQTTRPQAILSGVVSELQGLIFFIQYLFVGDLPASLVPIISPVPLLLIIGLLFLSITPPPKHAPSWPETGIASSQSGTPSATQCVRLYL